MKNSADMREYEKDASEKPIRGAKTYQMEVLGPENHASFT